MKLLGVPRRAQTLAVAVFWTAAFLLALLAAWPPLHAQLQWLLLAYAAWLYLDWGTCDRGGRADGRGWSWFRGARFWRYFRDYFPATLVKTAELPPDRNYLLCAYPHGVFSLGAVCSFATDALNVKALFPGMRPNMVWFRQIFMVPFLRELFLAQGVISSEARGIRHALSDPRGGRLVVLMVGGHREAQLAQRGDYRIVLRRRRGFACLALQTGAPLVPVFAFNEHALLSPLRGLVVDRIQDWCLRVLGFALLMPVGRGLFSKDSSGVLPHRLPLGVVVGAPIPVERTAEPSDAQIGELMARFEKALFDLFHAHRDAYHPGQDVRLIVEE